MTIAAKRVPILAVAILSMACGAWLGLIRLGWNLPLPWQDLLIDHGPLMVCGFLGTVIGLERAVALDARWGYAAPILTAAGALLLDISPVHAFAPLLITAGSIVVFAIFAVLWRRQPELFVATMAAGSAAWTAGNIQWMNGSAIYRVVFCWVTFLVLTIAGERLELNRLRVPSMAVRAAFVAAALVLIGGAVAGRAAPETGTRIVGVGCLLLSMWLLVNDVARRTVLLDGLTKFMALSLLAGYVWLGVGGIIAIVTAAATPGPAYDATLHAIFLGFVMSMVFAHAPVIFPSVLRVQLPYRPAFYLHVVLLHGSVLLRVIGDLNEDLVRWRVWGGLLNALALLLFVINTAAAIATTRQD
jgi:hypothetical protein